MQKKHLIAFTLVTIFMLLGYNVVNNYFHEQRRAALVDNEVSSAVTLDNNTSDDPSAQPLGKQPKAVIDNVTNQIEDAQQIESKRLEQMESAQQ